jgi:hypothetical protein
MPCPKLQNWSSNPISEKDGSGLKTKPLCAILRVQLIFEHTMLYREIHLQKFSDKYDFLRLELQI